VSGESEGVGPGNGSARALVRLVNRNGMHARPAHLFVQTANQFESTIQVGRPGSDSVNGKSIMGIMMLAAEHGAELELVAEGPDAEALLQALRELVDSGFGED
jgi:phosphocarrier protein HPr